MPNESELAFDNIVAYRQQLQKFCCAHYTSLIEFKDGVSFKLNLTEQSLGTAARHLSSTATCIESLLDCPPEFLPKESIDISALARDFSLAAMHRTHAEWLSDGSASIYCRCRTLPLVVYYLPTYQRRVQGHLKRIFSQLQPDASRLAIGEASGNHPDPDSWYPPNAYHTYWTLYLLHAINEKFPEEHKQLQRKFAGSRFDLTRLREEMLLWAQRTVGYQIALHVSGSSILDSDQLAWSLATIVKFQRDFQANLAQQDFIRCALKCLFEQQTDIGIWRTGAPLFHYLRSGNAYCYIFETFAVLLKSALTNRKEGLFLRQVLRPYVAQLLALWRYATSTQIPLSRQETIGWSSGHRANRKEPESWATASVYSFSQHLRRLIGIWARESAAVELKVDTSHVSSTDAVKTLAERGATWAPIGKTAASQLMTLFINPTRRFESGNCLEPDSQPINDDQARGAILFGPPGTSKTTLSRCVADAIGWDYVELHASTFVADGLPNVQRTANRIFERLSQLDRTVILFDEIDELVRARDMEPDAFGRFLTTSMLPKLAELWKLRKVIYFVATNHISFFDLAVIRAQRFDALVHVSPPSLQRKLRRVKELLQGTFRRVRFPGINSSHVEAALRRVVELNDKSQATSPEKCLLPDSCIVAKLLLMRWDQLQELASAIKKSQIGRTELIVSRKVLEEALSALSDPSLRKCAPFKNYQEASRYEQHDFSKVNIWEVRGKIPTKEEVNFERKCDVYWYVSKAAFGDFTDFPRGFKVAGPGILTWRRKITTVDSP